MGPMWPVLVALPFAWLLGTFPTAGLVARAHGVDISKVGSGNPGASNVLRALGRRAFVLVMVGDVLKGAIATGVGVALGGAPGGVALGVAAVLGHTFPLYRKGGKGVATAAGMVAVLFPPVTAVLAVAWVLIALVAHKASLASLLCAVAFPVLVGVFGYPAWEIAVTAVVAVLVIARHTANIRRLVRGEEGDLRAPTRETGPTGG
jgi:acyl phosphate:glycerol-3-phosphate acyltransferase